MYSKKNSLKFIILFIIAALIFQSIKHNRIRNNVILITIDCLRFDHLSCYGYKRNTSPNIDILARKGILFREAISQASWTRPSVRSLISSTYPSTHGVYLNDQELSNPISTLHQTLKGEGYSTGFISNHGSIASRDSVFRQGFDTFRDIAEANATKITKMTIQWLKKNRNENFFLWVHYMDAHDHSINFPQEKISAKNITAKEIDTYTLKYDIAISFIDKEIGKLLNILNELNLYQNTVIVITADHGEEICEHGSCFTHGGPLWDTLIKVPLIVSCPRLLAKGKLIAHQVQHIDIAPTICEILRIKKPGHFEGQSFLPLIKGKKRLPSYAFSEHIETKNDLTTGDWIFTKISIRSAEWKLIYRTSPGDKGYELYNLKKDPVEITNLTEIQEDQFKLLKQELNKWMRRTKQKITPSRISLDEKVKDRLRSLGYIQ